MNLPNRLTLSRIGLTFVFMLFLFSKGMAAKYAALITFLIASFTDFYDGYIAKKYNMVTDFGRLMDPIADKILVIAAFLAFVELNVIPAWMVVLIIARELIITGLRLFASTKGKIISAARGGKHKTASQIVAIFSILSFFAIKETFLTYTDLWNARVDHFFTIAIFVLMLFTVALTLASGISYLVRNRGLLINVKNYKVSG